jgi:hypothetical protein
MDWLQSHNPMGLDCVGKRMAFWEHGRLVMLIGIRSNTDSCKEVDTKVLTNMLHQAMVAHVVQVQQLEMQETKAAVVPSEIDQVLTEFDQVFKEPEGLPPPCPFDHAIPLVLGQSRLMSGLISIVQRRRMR